MFVQICPKCGTPMNVAFALYEKDKRRIHLQCPKCFTQQDDESSVVETLYFQDVEVETRAGLEGIEAQVMV